MQRGRHVRGSRPADRESQVWAVWSAKAGWCGHYHRSRESAERCLKDVHRAETGVSADFVAAINGPERCVVSFRAVQANTVDGREYIIARCVRSIRRAKELAAAAREARSAAAARPGDQDAAAEADVLENYAERAAQGHPLDFAALARRAPGFWAWPYEFDDGS